MRHHSHPSRLHETQAPLLAPGSSPLTEPPPRFAERLDSSARPDPYVRACHLWAQLLRKVLRVRPHTKETPCDH